MANVLTTRPWHIRQKNRLALPLWYHRVFHRQVLSHQQAQCWCKMFNILRPRQNGCHFPDDILKCIFFDENVLISIKISPKFVPKSPINNFPALVQIMAWHRSGDKPLSETMLAGLLTHICVTRPQWVNRFSSNFSGCQLFCITFMERMTSFNLTDDKISRYLVVLRVLTHWRRLAH